MNHMTERVSGVVKGDIIAHDEMHTLRAEVLDVKPCEGQLAGLEHDMFLVEVQGESDWVCAFDVHKVEPPSSFADRNL